MKYCSRCVMPDTRPGTNFIGDTCQACVNYDNRKNVDWNARWEELVALTNRYVKTDGSYDCVIPVSGGKDSHFLVDLFKNKLDMHPLLVFVYDGFSMTEAGKHNLRNLSEHFGCDLIEYTPNLQWLKRITRVEFETQGNFPHVDSQIYHIPVEIAKKFGISLVCFGEDSAFEYGTSTEWSNHIPGEPNAIYTSYYVPWSSYGNYIQALKHGFRDLREEWKRVDCIEDWDSIDSIGWQLSNFMKYQKLGYGRATDIACRLIREGRLTRSEAIELVKLHEGKLDTRVHADFTEFTGYSALDFMNILKRYWNDDVFRYDNKDGWVKKPEYRLR